MLYKQIFEGLEFCPDPLACMTRVSNGGFAYISWKVVNIRNSLNNKLLPDLPTRHNCQKFIDSYGKKQIYQVILNAGIK